MNSISMHNAIAANTIRKYKKLHWRDEGQCLADCIIWPLDRHSQSDPLFKMYIEHFDIREKIKSDS